MKDLSGEDNRKSEFAKVYENNCGRIYNYVMMMKTVIPILLKK